MSESMGLLPPELATQSQGPARRRSRLRRLANDTFWAQRARLLGRATDSDSSCLFCKFDDGALNKIIFENRFCYVRLDNFPSTEGHVEVVPKRHLESYFGLSKLEARDTHALLLKARNYLVDEYGPDGFTIGVNDGRAAGRTIDHLHIHLIPRRFGDVADPRGGIRQVLPRWDPDAWSQSAETPTGTVEGGIPQFALAGRVE